MTWGVISRPRQAVIRLPRTFSRDTMYAILNAVLDENQDYKHKRITLDFTHLQAIQAGGVAVLSNLIEAARKSGASVQFTGANACRASGFLIGSGFHYLYFDQKSTRAETTREHLPLRLVEYEQSQSYIRNHAAPWIASAIGTEERALATLQVCLEEIFNNINDHSTIDVGCSYANFNSSEKTIIFCISDFGIGIPANVRKKMTIGTDAGAIAMACQNGFTTQTTGRNMGAGLHVLLQNLVLRNKGVVRILSGRGIYSCVNEHGILKKTGRRAKGSYPGTMIYMTIDATKFIPDDVSEDFSWD